MFRFDYNNEGKREEIIYDKYRLDETPICGVLNDAQDKFIVTTSKNTFFCDITNDSFEPRDIDE